MRKGHLGVTPTLQSSHGWRWSSCQAKFGAPRSPGHGEPDQPQCLLLRSQIWRSRTEEMTVLQSAQLTWCSTKTRPNAAIAYCMRELLCRRIILLRTGFTGSAEDLSPRTNHHLDIAEHARPCPINAPILALAGLLPNKRTCSHMACSQYVSRFRIPHFLILFPDNASSTAPCCPAGWLRSRVNARPSNPSTKLEE
jgi:hypothetical protein